jgi:hypothetical protein
VDTTSGSEHTTRQNRTEVKPDGAREIRWGEGAGIFLRVRDANLARSPPLSRRGLREKIDL